MYMYLVLCTQVIDSHVIAYEQIRTQNRYVPLFLPLLSSLGAKLRSDLPLPLAPSPVGPLPSCPLEATDSHRQRATNWSASSVFSLSSPFAVSCSRVHFSVLQSILPFYPQTHHPSDPSPLHAASSLLFSFFFYRRQHSSRSNAKTRQKNWTSDLRQQPSTTTPKPKEGGQQDKKNNKQNACVVGRVSWPLQRLELASLSTTRPPFAFRGHLDPWPGFLFHPLPAVKRPTPD